MRRTLVGGRIALLGVEGLVERGITRPGLEDADVEIEPVHLGEHQAVVHLARDRPRRGIDAAQARPKRRELCVPALEGRSRVVGCAIAQWRPLESSPLPEQLDERFVTVFHDLLLGRGGRRGDDQRRSDEDPRDELTGASH